MAPIKKEKAEMSAFERMRLENMSANQEILKDMSNTAARLMPQPVGRPKSKTGSAKKKATPIKREVARPTRTSSRLAGVEADSETAKRKAEVEFDFAREQAKAKKQRVSGDLNFSDIVVDGKKFSKDDGFLSGIMRGAMPNVRTFTEENVKETTDEGLKALREKMGGLELYDGFEPNRRCCVEDSKLDANSRQKSRLLLSGYIHLDSTLHQTSLSYLLETKWEILGSLTLLRLHLK